MKTCDADEAADGRQLSSSLVVALMRLRAYFWHQFMTISEGDALAPLPVDSTLVGRTKSGFCVLIQVICVGFLGYALDATKMERFAPSNE